MQSLPNMGGGKESGKGTKDGGIEAASNPASAIVQKGQANYSKAGIPNPHEKMNAADTFTEIDLGPPVKTVDDDEDDILDASWHIVSTADYTKK